MKNPIVKLLQAITDVVNTHMKLRAITMGDVFSYIQNKLEMESVTEAGNVSDGMARSGYVVDVYMDSTSMYALISRQGKLYKSLITIGENDEINAGEYQEVTVEFAPVTGRQLQVTRQADGQIRWFAMPACTAALNRSGEIDSRALFDSFVDFAERTGEYPELDFWHLGENLTLGRADWVGRDDVNYCASGLFYDTPIARAAAKSMMDSPDYWGLSIAYIPTSEPEILKVKDGGEIPVFNSGINRYISLLPENSAASILTSITTKEGVQRMNEKMKDALKKLTGTDEELFKTLEEQLDGINRSAAEMITREGEAVQPEAAQEFEDKITAIIEKVLAARPQVQAAEPVTPEVKPVERDANKDLMAMVTALSAKVDELLKSREAAVKEVLDDLPAKVTRQKIYRPRAAITPNVFDKTQGVNLADIANETLSRMSQPES